MSKTAIDKNDSLATACLLVVYFLPKSKQSTGEHLYRADLPLITSHHPAVENKKTV